MPGVSLLDDAKIGRGPIIFLPTIRDVWRGCGCSPNIGYMGIDYLVGP
jgi:hypothetical protein